MTTIQQAFALVDLLAARRQQVANAETHVKLLRVQRKATIRANRLATPRDADLRRSIP